MSARYKSPASQCVACIVCAAAEQTLPGLPPPVPLTPVPSAGVSLGRCRVLHSVQRLTRAMGPPSCASGATWPMTKPCEPPENRPSVISAQSCSRYKGQGEGLEQGQQSLARCPDFQPHRMLTTARSNIVSSQSRDEVEPGPRLVGVSKLAHWPAYDWTSGM